MLANDKNYPHYFLLFKQSINQFKLTYTVPCVMSKSDAHAGRVFTFTVGNVKEFGFYYTLKYLKAQKMLLLIIYYTETAHIPQNLTVK